MNKVRIYAIGLLMILLGGIFGLRYRMILSVIPFLIVSILFIRNYRKT